ncbi:MAG: hypothetical protein KIS63_18985 [Caldilineales bacterium]|nr:hypothetical protein [Caldilineales bacterium]
MKTQRISAISLLLALAMALSLCVSPVASAQSTDVPENALQEPDQTPLSGLNTVSVPPLLNVAKLSVGSGHNCVLTTSGAVKCWGNDWVGQVGDGAGGMGIDRYVPQDVADLASDTITAVVAGGGHSCALLGDGSLKCWGYNDSGQLGIGVPPSETVYKPRSVVNMPGPATAVAAGGYHACAVINGGAYCWGSNEKGQVGDGTNVTRTKPTAVAGLGSGVIAVSTGYKHSCAVTNAGAVKCWGWNENGALGDGTTTDRTTPVDVSGLSSGIAAVSAGGRNTCVLTTGGGVKCWGFNKFGQLGNGTTTDSQTPVDVIGLSSGVAAVATGDAFNDEPGHICALTTEGWVKCWGLNTYGQLGDGTATNHSTPVDVLGLGNDAVALGVGQVHACALTRSGGVKCWGANYWGQLGVDWFKVRAAPVDVMGLTGGLAALAGGSSHTCALTDGGGVKCWGWNLSGALGNGTTLDSAMPVDVCAGGAAGCAARLSGVKVLAAGGAHNCAVTDAGGVKCWGQNGTGELGNGKIDASLTPGDVFGLTSGVKSVGAGGNHSCAVTDGGGLKCWGRNTHGQLGEDSTAPLRRKPVDVVGLSSGVAAVAGGSLHTCALTTGGGVKCWGTNYFGEAGAGTTTDRRAPVDVIGLSGVVALALGGDHSCALTSAGGVKCWGRNLLGELGDGTTMSRDKPVDVVGLTSGVTALAANGGHTCALVGGGVKCWGYNGYGELGDGTVANSSTPHDVMGMSSGVTAVAAGGSHTCTLVGNGRPKCWGWNMYGALGQFAMRQTPLPMDVSAGPLPPQLSLNYTIGARGSILTLSGAGWPAKELTVNGVALGTIPKYATTGEFLIFLDTSAADDGVYDIQAGDNPAVTASFIVAASAPQRQQEGGGLTTLTIPGGIAGPVAPLYLPLMQR